MPWQPSLFFFLLAYTALASTEESARKVFTSRCWACHSQTALGGLRLDSREAMLRGGKSGPALLAGNAKESRIYQAASHTNPAVKAMPPGVTLTSDELRTIETWINEGAPWT
ncbi:MAG: hypothetical protein H7Y20_03970, partial [Bryobacteraceae bacterium]|nr:hypothetical protein [Bryobacteraceae bacterium]